MNIEDILEQWNGWIIEDALVKSIENGEESQQTQLNLHTLATQFPHRIEEIKTSEIINNLGGLAHDTSLYLTHFREGMILQPTKTIESMSFINDSELYADLFDELYKGLRRSNLAATMGPALVLDFEKWISTYEQLQENTACRANATRAALALAIAGKNEEFSYAMGCAPLEYRIAVQNSAETIQDTFLPGKEKQRIHFVHEWKARLRDGNGVSKKSHEEMLRFLKREITHPTTESKTEIFKYNREERPVTFQEEESQTLLLKIMSENPISNRLRGFLERYVNSTYATSEEHLLEQAHILRAAINSGDLLPESEKAERLDVILDQNIAWARNGKKRAKNLAEMIECAELDIDRHISYYIQGEGSMYKVFDTRDTLTREGFVAKIPKSGALKAAAEMGLDEQDVARKSSQLRKYKSPYLADGFLIRDKKGNLILLETPLVDDLKTIISEGRLKEKKIPLYARQIIQGIKTLHDYEIIHADIKPNNIGLSERGTMAIFDAVEAVTFGEFLQGNERGGTFYRSRDVYEGLLTPAADLFAYANVLFEMIMKKHPLEYSGLEVSKADLTNPQERTEWTKRTRELLEDPKTYIRAIEVMEASDAEPDLKDTFRTLYRMDTTPLDSISLPIALEPILDL